MKKSVLVFMLVLTVAMSFIAVSCGAKKTTLELYYYKQENQEGLKAVLDAYTKVDTTVAFKTLIIPNDADAAMAARAAQNKLPDIMQMQSYSRVTEYASKGYLVDLSADPVLSMVVDGAKPAVTWNDKQWALPMDFAGIGIIYNKKLFADNGLNPPTTYKELEAVVKALKAKGITPYSGLLKENWSIGHFITLVQTNLLAEKGIAIPDFIAGMNAGTMSYGVVDTAKLFSIIDDYKNAMDPNAKEMAWNEQQAAFIEGKAAMMVQGLWALPGADKGMDCGFIPFPVSNNKAMNKFYADVDSCFGISSQSTPEKQAAALKFLNWLGTPEAIKLWVEGYRLTVSFKGADVSALPSPFVDLMTSVNANGSYPWAFSMYPSVVFEDACKNGAQQYVFGTVKAADVIKNIDAMWAANKPAAE